MAIETNSALAVDEDGEKILKAGTVYPSNDASALGIVLKDVILGEKLYNKLFHRKDKAPSFETEDPVEWVESKINSFSEPIDNLGAVDVEEWNQIDNLGFVDVDVEEWNQNTHNIFQNLSEEKRLEILKLFATKD